MEEYAKNKKVPTTKVIVFFAWSDNLAESYFYHPGLLGPNRGMTNRCLYSCSRHTRACKAL